MSWIKENKFVAGLAGATVVVGGVVLFFGNSQGNAYEEKMQAYQDLKGQYAKLEKSKPYPNSANLEARENGIDKYETVIGEVRTALQAYYPGELPKPTPEEFNNTRAKMEQDLIAAFTKSKVVLPEGCHFGFEKYAEASAKSAATPKLNFQLGAVNWLMTKLAEAKPSGIISIVRTELPVESGKAATPEPPRRARPSRNRNQPAEPQEPTAYQLLPMELAFTGDEAAVRRFLKEMVNSKEYFYAIRSMRVRNEKQVAPNQKDVDFPDDGGAAAGDGAGNPFGGFPAEGEEEGAADDVAAVEGERILKQVLGNEKVHVHLCFDIVLIKENAAEAKPAGR